MFAKRQGWELLRGSPIWVRDIIDRSFVCKLESWNQYFWIVKCRLIELESFCNFTAAQRITTHAHRFGVIILRSKLPQATAWGSFWLGCLKKAYRNFNPQRIWDRFNGSELETASLYTQVLIYDEFFLTYRCVPCLTFDTQT